MSAPRLRVLVLTAFGPDVAADDSGELGRWLDGYGEFDREVSVPGAPVPVRITDRGVGVTATGIGPTRAAATATAILASDAVDTDDAYVLTAGIAGISPEIGTLGSVVLADHIVNWDAKKRYGDGGAEPWGFGPPQAYELDPDLVAAARDAAVDVDLADSASAHDHRIRYDASAAAGSPKLAIGTTVSGADFWHGRDLAKAVESLVDTYDAGAYATTECEGFGAAVACDRFDLLDRYLSVRAASNFDRPPADADERFDGWRMKGPAFVNAYRVGRTIADEIAENWVYWRDGPPAATR